MCDLILFYDFTTPFAYTGLTAFERGMGGTESTVLRIAEALANTHKVYVAEHCRSLHEEIEHNGVYYISLESAHKLRLNATDAVILIRQYKLVELVATYHPKAQLFLWMHNLAPHHLYRYAPVLAQY